MSNSRVRRKVLGFRFHYLVHTLNVYRLGHALRMPASLYAVPRGRQRLQGGTR